MKKGEVVKDKINQATGQYSEGYLRYALGMFLLVYIVNFVDRQIFSILIEPIKQEIELSDTQLGLLGGIAFALFYTFAGIPIARWADVGTRKNIVALAILIWSAMTMLTSTAKSFSGLLLARVGVGIGEDDGTIWDLFNSESPHICSQNTVILFPPLLIGLGCKQESEEGENNDRGEGAPGNPRTNP